MGFALGLASANYFAETENEDKATATQTATTTPPPLNFSKISKDHESPTVLNVVPIKPTPNRGLPKDNVGINNTLTEDISLSETVDSNRQEAATTEPSSEELVKAQPIGLVTTPLSYEETDHLENKLRLKSEDGMPIPLGSNNRLLEHE